MAGVDGNVVVSSERNVSVSVSVAGSVLSEYSVDLHLPWSAR